MWLQKLATIDWYVVAANDEACRLHFVLGSGYEMGTTGVSSEW